jgi:hypothetical protein
MPTHSSNSMGLDYISMGLYYSNNNARGLEMTYASFKTLITDWGCDNCQKTERTQSFTELAVPARPAGWLVPKSTEEAFHEERLVFCCWDCLNAYVDYYLAKSRTEIDKIFAEVEG